MGVREVFLFDAVRTPRGKGSQSGALAAVAPYELVRQLVDALRRRLDPDVVDGVEKLFLSCVGQVGAQGGHIAMVCKLHARLNPATTVLSMNNFCAGGLSAIGAAAAAIRSGDLDLAVAGGVESMSHVRFLGDNADYYMNPDLSRALSFVPVGLSADYLAFSREVSREDLDALTLDSHRRADAAWRAGRYDASVVPVLDKDGATVLARDETIRPKMTAEDMRALPPVFEKDGRERYDDVIRAVRPGLGEIEHRHSLANCPPIADGAALVVLGSAEAGARLGLAPLARLSAFAEAAGDPVDQLTSGVAAMRRILERTRGALEDFGLIEFMEAFAVVPALFHREFSPDPARVNVNGGHLAMGHPMGATGAILTATLAHEMRFRDAPRGLVVATGGSGVGAAAILEAP